MLKIDTIKVIYLNDWNKLIKDTYNKPYNFQQTCGCQRRGLVTFNVPEDIDELDLEDLFDDIPEIVNHDNMEVKFNKWLAKDPDTTFIDKPDYQRSLWWHRNFYPNFQILANDLHSKGLIETGTYSIKID